MPRRAPEDREGNRFAGELRVRLTHAGAAALDTLEAAAPDATRQDVVNEMLIKAAVMARSRAPQMKINPIRRARVDKGLTQTELALRLNIAQSTLSKIELGDMVPTPELEAKIREILGDL